MSDRDVLRLAKLLRVIITTAAFSGRRHGSGGALAIPCMNQSLLDLCTTPTHIAGTTMTSSLRFRSSSHLRCCTEDAGSITIGAFPKPAAPTCHRSS